MINMITLTKYAGEYISLKFKEISFTFKSLKSYVSNNVEGQSVQFPDNIFWNRKDDMFKLNICFNSN